jgi:hypothetical protein
VLERQQELEQAWKEPPVLQLELQLERQLERQQVPRLEPLLLVLE